jgi:inhibitor of KinA sporulation pathway (predicted exonuclease)
MKPLEIFTSLDLEMAQPSKKIIQVGACVGNIITGEVLEKLSVFVNPQEPLSQFIIDLTGIKQSDVDSGTTLSNAYDILKRFHKRHDGFINPLVWGGGDSLELFEQLKLEKPELNLESPEWCFGRRWIDVKTLFISWRLANQQQIQGGLAKSMLKVGLRFNGRKHSAVDDSVNTFLMYCKMLSLLKKD